MSGGGIVQTTGIPGGMITRAQSMMRIVMILKVGHFLGDTVAHLEIEVENTEVAVGNAEVPGTRRGVNTGRATIHPYTRGQTIDLDTKRQERLMMMEAIQGDDTNLATDIEVIVLNIDSAI